MTRFLTLLLAVASLSGCSDVLAPLIAVDVEIRGMDWSVGSYEEASSYRDIPEGYRCEPVLRVRAKGGSRYARVGWIGATIKTKTMDGAVLSNRSLNAREVDRMIGHLSSGSENRTAPIPVVANTLPFAWTLTLHYYDEEVGIERETRFSAKCLDGASGS